VGALLLQIAANLANDVYDHEKGADDATRLGPVRAVQAGLLTPRQVRIGLAVTLLATVAVGATLVAVGGWPILLLGLASLASAVAYTGGPWPLGYHGLGDVFVFAFFGPAAVAGTVYVQRGEVPWLAWPCAIAAGALATAVLVVNNVRDADTDGPAGKRTVVVRWGRRFGITQYRSLLACALAMPLVLAWRHPWSVLALVTLPSAWRLSRAVALDHGAALNATLVGTARLLLAFAILLSVGVAA
jgi:1,4-dihydroxy-2-naphthoate octaprenyltransferase